MTRVRRFERLDREALRPPERMDNGFLRVDGRIARVGIQEYRDGAGQVHRELRLPEEVFDAASLASFDLMPVTNGHPPVMLDAGNATKYAVGAVGELRADGDYIAARILLHDANAIAAAEAGRSQLSNGYSCELDDTQDPTLTARWGKYDSIQRNIRGNHLALVDVARAGPGASLRLDGADAVAGVFGDATAPVLASTSPTHGAHQDRETHTMAKLRIDGFEFEIADANAQAVADRAIAQAKKDGDAKAADAEKARAAAATELAEAKAKLDAAEAKVKVADERKIDCLECKRTGKIDGAKCEGCDGEGSVAVKNDSADRREASFNRAVARAAASHAALRVQAMSVLGANAKLDGKTDDAVRREVVEYVTKIKLDGAASVDTVRGAYEAAVAVWKRDHGGNAGGGNPPPATTPIGSPPPAHTDGNADPGDAAYRKMVERNLAANKRGA